MDNPTPVENINSLQELHCDLYRLILGEGIIRPCEVTQGIIVHGNKYSIVISPPTLDSDEERVVLVGKKKPTISACG